MLTVTLTLGLVALVSPTPARAAGAAGAPDQFYQPTQPIIDQRALAYLQKFGYLPRGELETGNLQSAEMVTKALKNFQRFAKLPPTGKMDGATWRQMEKPRCGNAEVVKASFPFRRRKRFVIAASKWEKHLLTFRILNFTPDLRQAESRDSIVRAFNVWARVTNLGFREKTSGPADIMIRFTRTYHHDGYPFDGKGSVLAHAFYPGEDRGGDIHFDEDETWTFSGKQGVNLFSVATHEIGHALGLAHSQVPPALMYPWYNGEAELIKLHSDDVVAIQYLYGQRSSPGNPRVTDRPEPPKPYPTRDMRSPATKRQVPTTFVPTVRPEPTRPPREDDPGKRPNPCKTPLSVDAIANIRGEIFIFSGSWFWRVRDGQRNTEPYYLHHFWFGLPKSIRSVDAVLVRHDGNILFFVGKRYFEMTDNHRSRGFPEEGRPLTDLGLPADIKKIDAAFRWSYNDLTYFISGDMYWKYNEHQKTMYPDYPRDMSMWSGVPLPVDAAFLHKERTNGDKRTYFLKGDNVWRFKDIRMSVKKGRWPRPWTELFLLCNTTRMANDIYGVSAGKVAYDNVAPASIAATIGHHDAKRCILLLVVYLVLCKR